MRLLSPITQKLTCALLLVNAAAFAAPLPKNQAPLEDESMSDPPALVWRTGSSPRRISTHGNFTSYQVNVDTDGENIIGDAANEPSITVDPTDPSRMAIGWRQFNSLSSSSRRGGYAFTFDGGFHWTFSGSLTASGRSDPVLGADATGAFFYLSLVPNFFDDMWRSDDAGQSWFRLGPAYGGDKQWFTVDKTNSPGRGFLYQSWSSLGNNYDGRQFSRSIDSGSSWSDPIYIPGSPSWGTLDVDAHGDLFIGGVDLQSDSFWCVRSRDAKNQAVVPTFDQVTPIELGGSIILGSPINPEGLSGQLFLAADRSGTKTNNNLYVLASVQLYESNNGTDIVFARSTDGGASFSAPRRINDDPIDYNKFHWLGTMAIAPNGRIDVVWLDSRNAANNTDSQLFYSYSSDGGVTWSPNVAVSDPFDPYVGYPVQEKMGDYITLVSDNGGGNVAYCATFNQEEDIYYVRVSPTLATLPPLAIRSITRDGTGTTITFPASSGKTYRCELSDRPSGPWTTLQANLIGTGADISIHDPAAINHASRFYRVVVTN